MDTMQSPFSSLAVFLKDLNALKYTEYSFWRHIVWKTDYGHTMAKSLILCGPNSNSNHNPK